MIKKHYYRALIRFDKKQEKNRQVESTRLVEQIRIAKQHEKIRLVKKRAEQQIKQTRFDEKTRQIQAARLANEIRIVKKRVKRLLQQQIEIRQVEKIRRVKKHAKRFAKQIRIEKKRAKTFACKRCNAKFFNNIKLHIHVQNYHQKKFIKFANEFAKITLTTKFASISTFFFTSRTKFVKIISNEFVKIISSNESTLMLTSFTSFAKSISKFSFFLISFVTSIATSRKQIF